MYMLVFKCTFIILFISTILINFTIETVFLFNANLLKWTCICYFWFKVTTSVLSLSF